jgi:hypothetical protein
MSGVVAEWLIRWWSLLAALVAAALIISLVIRARDQDEPVEDRERNYRPPLGMELRDTAALESLAHLQALNAERFYERRRVEWRLTFTLWAGLGLVANAIKDVEGLRPVHTIHIAAGIIVLLALQWGWEEVYVIGAARRNRLVGYDLENIIRQTIGIPTVQARLYRPLWAHHWQLIVTAILGIGLLLLTDLAQPLAQPPPLDLSDQWF